MCRRRAPSLTNQELRWQRCFVHAHARSDGYKGGQTFESVARKHLIAVIDEACDSIVHGRHAGRDSNALRSAGSRTHMLVANEEAQRRCFDSSGEGVRI